MDGEGVRHRLAAVGGVEEALVQRRRGAGWPSSPGWKNSRTRPASAPRRSASRRAAPTSMAVWASCPQACMPRRRPRRSRGRCPRARAGRPCRPAAGRWAGSPPSRSATIDDRPVPVRTVSGRPSSASSTRAWVRAVEVRAPGRGGSPGAGATTSSCTAPASRDQVVGHGRQCGPAGAGCGSAGGDGDRVAPARPQDAAGRGAGGGAVRDGGNAADVDPQGSRRPSSRR